MAHSVARERKWKGNWRMEWIASTLHTTSEHGVSSNTTADAHTSAASSRLNWRPRRFKWTRPFRRKTKSGFCACAITFQTQSTMVHLAQDRDRLSKTWKWTIGSRRIWRISWLGEELSASEEGRCSIELISSYILLSTLPNEVRQLIGKITVPPE